MDPKRWRLDGRKAIVTGATQGIGRAASQALLAFGASVTIVARDRSAVEERIAEWDAQGFSVRGIAADLATAPGRRRVVEDARQNGGCSILVNNVGTNLPRSIEAYTDEEIDLLVRTNQSSTFEMCRLMFPALKAAHEASVINVSSVAGLISTGSGTVYAMTKGGLVAFGRTLAVEWAPHNIRVNTVAPWFTRSPQTEKRAADPQSMKAILEATPLHDIGDPDDVAAAILFFALPAARFITGQTMAVDGGYLAFGSHY